MNINVKDVETYIRTKERIEKYKYDINQLNKFEKPFDKTLILSDGSRNERDELNRLSPSYSWCLSLDPDMNFQLRNALIEIINQKIETLEEIEKSLIIGQ